jgi:hypothetical protein
MRNMERFRTAKVRGIRVRGPPPCLPLPVLDVCACRRPCMMPFPWQAVAMDNQAILLSKRENASHFSFSGSGTLRHPGVTLFHPRWHGQQL